MDDRIPLLITNMIRARRQTRAEILSRQVAQLVKGISPSSSALATITNRACGRELEKRARYWLAIAKRVFADTRTAWSQQSATDIQKVISEELREDVAALDTVYKGRLRPSSAMPSESPAVATAHVSATNHVRLEVELLVLREEATRIPLKEQLSATRYAAVLMAWENAQQLFSKTRDDYQPVVVAAVAAVEQLARIFVGNPTATLGDAIREVQRTGRIPAPLLKGIAEIWGWASGEPGVRHGAAVDSPIDAGQAKYVLTLAEGALLLLLDRDDQ